MHTMSVAFKRTLAHLGMGLVARAWLLQECCHLQWMDWMLELQPLQPACHVYHRLIQIHNQSVGP